MALGLTDVETRIVLDRRTESPFRNVGELTNLLTSISGGGRQGFTLVPEGQPGAADPRQITASLSGLGTVTSKNFYVEAAARVTGSRLTARVAAILGNAGSAGRPKLSIKLWTLDPRQGA